MQSIERLSTDKSESQAIIQAVADIEIIIQPQDAWSDKTLSELLAQDSVQLLMVKNEAQESMGYCLYQVMFEQAEILRIGTHPDYQRQGIASKLFIELHRILQDQQVESLLLEVRADNAPAIKLYEQQNFTVIHQRCDYYQQPHQPSIDALVMQLDYNDQ